jgi:hypothetical protein
LRHFVGKVIVVDRGLGGDACRGQRGEQGREAAGARNDGGTFEPRSPDTPDFGTVTHPSLFDPILEYSAGRLRGYRRILVRDCG